MKISHIILISIGILLLFFWYKSRKKATPQVISPANPGTVAPDSGTLIQGTDQNSGNTKVLTVSKMKLVTTPGTNKKKPEYFS
jgi:hypothetical protein